MAVNPIAVYGVPEYILRASDPKYIEVILQEHINILNVPISGTCNNFLRPKNQKKNRYLIYTCWDYSRVVLFKPNSEPDYINANYLCGFDCSKKFIATQEPMPNTFDDFWNMVWQQNSSIVVMLNGTKIKSQYPCLQYFAPNQDNTILKEFIIKNKDIKEEPHYIKTTLSVTHRETGELRIIHHFKYLDWPENGVPDMKRFLDFLLAVNKRDQSQFRKSLLTNQPLPGPIVVHGNAGIGRTATFCVADICLYQLVHTASISVPSIVLKVREQRNFSMLSPKQYIFVNNVLLYFLVTIRSNVEMFFELRSHLSKKDVELLSLGYSR